MFEKGSKTDHFLIMLSGEFRIFIQQNGDTRFFTEMQPGQLTGVLPYSRMKEATGFAQAKEKSEVFALHRDCFPDMIHDHYELTAALVHHMTDRARNFTSRQYQNEKLVSLGKLSAGLAHELNNPASAIVRSAQELQKHLKLIPENFKAVINLDVTPEQVDEVNGILFSKIEAGERSDLSLMERTEMEDEIADWLEDNGGVEDGYELAGTLVDFGFSTDELDNMSSQVKEQDFPNVIKWIDDNLTTDKMVKEIADAAQRIAELVQSIKGYTHMDRSSAMQKVDLHPGIVSTLTMLKHKVKQNKVDVVMDFCKELNPVMGHPGELNQVFTNLIDNALDAMENTENAQLKITTWNDEKYVRIDIKDSGPGIPPDVLDKIFDPFFTTKEMGKGTGMGLDVVAKIIQKHKGVINVNTEPGKTVFELCFTKAV